MKNTKAKYYVIKHIDLQKLRKRAGLTQEDFANQVALSERHFRRLENGHIIMSEHIWEAVKNVLDKYK
uniref:Putative DNA binding, helix-turn-helix domain containing protein n=1 Tax=viral metagenome TaxID=1070528 RepID=A0A6H2A4U5_9ZZZZ